MRSGVPQSIEVLDLGRYSEINTIPTVQARKAVLFRKAPAANLCKCEKCTFETGQTEW